MQGVGFRPYVYRLAGELGLAGWVLNDERGVLLEVEGDGAAVEAFLERLPAEAPPLASVERLGRRSGRPPAGVASRSARAERRRAGDAPVSAGQRHLRRLPGRAVRPGRPPLPLPVHQLHQLRAALHDRARRPLRPAAHHDGRLRDVRSLPGRVRRPGRPPLPRAAERLPGVRARALTGALRWRRGRAPALRGDRGREGPRRLPPGLPRRSDEQAVAALRARKHREDKPFALMAPDLEAARTLVELGAGRGGAAARAASGRS